MMQRISVAAQRLQFLIHMKVQALQSTYSSLGETRTHASPLRVISEGQTVGYIQAFPA